MNAEIAPSNSATKTITASGYLAVIFANIGVVFLFVIKSFTSRQHNFI